MSEFKLIAKYFSRRSTRGDVVLGVGDDTAVLDVPSTHRLAAAIDTIVEDVHFPAGTDPGAIGHRALAVNLSDLAAMGAEPAWATLSLSLPKYDADWLEAFSSGLYALADRFNVALVGGDTVRGPLSVTISIMGLVEKHRWITRAGARPGDTLFISGVPGEAAAGLAVIQESKSRSSEADHLLNRFLWPEPRIEIGRCIRPYASAAIDVSDGLLADLQHICDQSGCGARVDVEALPASPEMRTLFSTADCERFALGGGDDYELLFTVAPECMLDVEAAIAEGVRCTPIGRITEGKGVSVYRSGQVIEPPRRGYDHFA